MKSCSCEPLCNLEMLIDEPCGSKKSSRLQSFCENDLIKVIKPKFLRGFDLHHMLLNELIFIITLVDCFRNIYLH